MTKEDRDIQRKLKVLRHAEKIGDVAKTCRYFGVGRSSFYRWKAAYDQHGDAGLVNAKPIPKNPANQTPPEIVDKVLYLRSTYHLGSIRIVWYLARYHGITISDAGVTRILRRNGVGRLPRGTRMRKVHTKRYNKQVPGHHIQMDVKFLTFIGKRGEKIRRFQYTAIDDATRVRALKVYDKHTQANAIDFVDHIIEKFPFRIKEIRTDNGHEFQAKFHWHVEDQGIRHAYIKRGTPQLNGKVERSHRSDQQEFYQLLSYSRRVVGWAVSDRMKKDLAIRALDMAVHLRNPPPGCLFHSDRGSQYCSYAYQKKLQAHGLRPSMSGKGNCYDNASVETFFKSLKAELIWRQKWPTRRQAEAAIFQYINGFYNTRRRHSYLGGISPLAFEARVA